jgi:hypothetical protein
MQDIFKRLEAIFLDQIKKLFFSINSQTANKMNNNVIASKKKINITVVQMIESLILLDYSSCIGSQTGIFDSSSGSSPKPDQF